jgi:cytochrome c-type biogenesis protein CcmH
MNLSAGLADRRRRLRFFARSALAATLAALAYAIDRGGMPAILAALAAALPLGFVLRLPRPHGPGADWRARADAAGLAAVLLGLAILFGALAAAHGLERRARIPALCDSQRAILGNWQLRLLRTVPVAGDGYTAIEAQVVASRLGAPAITMRPRLTQWFAGRPTRDGSAHTRLWAGDLSLGLRDFDAASNCITLEAAWRPLAGWAMIGTVLASLGALAMSLLAMAGLNWRANACARIAMRREDRPLAGRAAPARPQAPPSRLLTAVAIALAVVLAYLLVQPRPAPPPPPPYPAGAALIRARQSLLDGPANADRWIVIADAMTRRGRYAEAAEILLGAVEARPRGSEGWLALGDALYAHAGGVLTPAAALAYARADRVGLASYAARPLAAEAMERSGRPVLAREWRARSQNGNLLDRQP